MSLPSHIRSLDLDTAVYHYRIGLISEAEWLAYAHAWQTGAPRFGTRACNCDACVTRYPTHEGYRAP